MQVTKYKINKELLKEISQDKTKLKLYCYFFIFRAYATSGNIANISSKIKAISKASGIPLRNLYRYKKLLCQDKLCCQVNNTLFFVSELKLIQTEENNYTYIKCTPQKLEIFIRTKCYKYELRENKLKVHRKLKKISTSLPPEEFRLLLLDNYCNNFVFGESLKSIVQPDCTLNQFRVSKIFGTSSQSNGFYWQQKLQREGMIKIFNRTVQSSIKWNKNSSLPGKLFFDNETKTFKQNLRNEIVFINQRFAKI